MTVEPDPHEFGDAEPEDEDWDAVDAYLDELAAAVEAFGVPIVEPGDIRPAPEEAP